MYKKKRDSHSNNRVDSDGRSIGAANNEPAEKTQLPDTNENTNSLAEVISRVQVVRVPGRGKVSGKEIIEAAIDQGEAFRRWREKGDPVGEVEVWVDGERVMCVLPERSAELQDFTFRVPSPNTAVLQLTTQTQGERTVLYNLLLRDVPARPLVHTETWPNGQSMSLTIKRLAVAAAGAAGFGASSSEQVSHFRISVALSPRTTESEMSIGSLKSETPPVTRDNERVPVSEKPRAKAATRGAALLLLLCAGLSIGFIAKPKSVYREWTQQRTALQTPTADSPRVVPSENVEIASSDPGSPGETTALNSSETKSRNSSSTATVPRKVSDKSSTSGKENVQIAPAGAALLPWQAMVLPKLAVLKNIYVNMDPQTAEPAGLKKLFVQTLEGSDQFNVLADTDKVKADGVVTLRFEPSSPCLGVVFAKVTGRDGKFLWEDFAWEAPRTCVTIPSENRDKRFIDASTALVDKLENTVRQAQETTKGSESVADGR